MTAPATIGAMTQARPSRPRYGPSVPTFVVGFSPGGRNRKRFFLPATARSISADHSVQMPLVRYALQRVLARVLEHEIRSRDEVPYGRGDEDHPGVGGSRDPGPDMDGDATNVVAVDLDLSRVHARPDL